MLKRVNLLTALAVVVLLGASRTVEGQFFQIPPVDGVASLPLRPARTALGPGEQTILEVDIDLSATRDEVCGWTGPTRLAGYQVTASFDTTALELATVRRCASMPESLGVVFFTQPNVASSNGGFVSAHGLTSGTEPGPTGRICLATFVFRRRAGSASAQTSIRFGEATTLDGHYLGHAAAADFRSCPFATNSSNPPIVLAAFGRGSDPTVGTAAFALTDSATAEPLIGDVTRDGARDVFDLVTLASMIVGNVHAGVAPYLGTADSGDVDRSTRVDVFDVVRLAAVIAGNEAPPN